MNVIPQGEQPTTRTQLQHDLYQAISVDAFDVLGIEKRPLLKKLVKPLFRPIGNRFAGLLAQFEYEAENDGFQQAVNNLLPRFVNSVQSVGQEGLPADGPLILASNHPAAYDAFLLASALPRDDLKIVATDIQLVNHMPYSASHFIFIGSAGQPDRFHRMSAVRAAIRHLRSGGSLLIFPGALVDPDPAISSGAEAALDRWSPSLELFIRKVPDTAIILSIVSGVLSKRWLNNPLTRLRREPHNRQKVAEVLQVIEQLFLPGRLQLDPKISFSHQLKPNDYQIQRAGETAPLLIEQAKQLLAQHMITFYGEE